MYRQAFVQLQQWKNTPDEQRKPLIIGGARQVGKTWLAREFGKLEFSNVVEVNFEDVEQIKGLFEADFDIDRILLAIQSLSGKKIIPRKTLLFFNEIQHARRGLLALKYFKDKAPQYHVMAAGSLLGVIDHKDDSFPVGKVDFLYIRPLSFEEFLLALGKEGLVDMLRTRDTVSINAFASQYADLLRQYFYIGGMPEVVKTFVLKKDYQAVRKVQLSILRSYEHDFSKHPPKEIVKRMQILWDSIPGQLAKENRKFVFSAVKSGARARDFETAIQWLCDAGMTHKVTRVNKGELPLSGFEDTEAFKLFILDIGLMGAIARLTAESLINGNDFFAQYKGALVEQFVLQELLLMPEIQIHYWTPDVGVAEVDFVVQLNGEIVPIEAKAVRNLQAKSLKEFSKRYPVKHIIRTSLEPMLYGETVIELPIYAISLLPQIILTNDR